jgi:CBS domain-containing protein
MKVSDAMAREVAYARPDEEIGALAEAMRDAGTGFLPVVDDGRLVGVVTDRDIVVRGLAAAGGDPRTLAAADVMTREVVTVRGDASLADAARVMSESEVRRLPVTDGDGGLQGVLSHGSLVQAADGEQDAMTATLGVTRGA